MSSPRLAYILLAGLCLHSARCAPLEDFVRAIYRPAQAADIALSPDGEWVAYSDHERGKLSIYLMPVGRTQRKLKIAVQDDRPIALSKEKIPASLRFLAWASPTRLVFAPTPYEAGLNTIAPIFAVSIDGSAPKTLAEADDFVAAMDSSRPSMIDNPAVQMRATSSRLVNRDTDIVGFAPGHRESLLVRARGLPVPPPLIPIPTSLFAINVTTGEKKLVAKEVANGKYLPDLAGNLRLLYHEPLRSPTRSFRLKKTGILDRWATLDETVGGTIAKSFIVTPENYFGERAFPLGFDLNPDVLYYASNIGRDTYGLYALDVRTKQRTPFAIEEPGADLAQFEPDGSNGLIFDELTGQFVGVRIGSGTRRTHWTDPELTVVQADVDRKFPQRTVEILQWDDARQRFLLRVTGATEAGRYYVFQLPENVLVEVARSRPWLRPNDLHPSTPFAFDLPSGVHLKGYLTFPRHPRINPPPLLIDFSGGPLGVPAASFHREAQVLAEMGFIVARVSHRGVSGLGLAHRNAVRDGGERMIVDEGLATIEWIAAHHAIDRKRIATIGHGPGGYLALRALQMEPNIFRCGVAIDAPLSIEEWLQSPLEPTRSLPASARRKTVRSGPEASAESALPSANFILGGAPPPPPIDFMQEARRAFLFGGTAKWASVLSSPETLTKPVMLIVNQRDDSVIAVQNASLRSKLSRLGTAPEFIQTEIPKEVFLPGSHAKKFRQMSEFFNLNLYDFGVKVGPTKELK